MRRDVGERAAEWSGSEKRLGEVGTWRVRFFGLLYVQLRNAYRRFLFYFIVSF